jgi:glutathione S-transferase
VSLTLYYHPLSSFCHKVLVALYEGRIEFERRIINLGDENDRAALLAVSPIGKFPVIHDSDRERDVAETSIIIEYLDHFFAGGMIPREFENALEARLWDRLFDLYVQSPMQQIVGDRLHGAEGDRTKERATLKMAYEMVEQRLGERPWVAGNAFSMADCAAAPALFYAATVESIPEGLGRLRDYFDRLMERPSVRRVLAEAKPYFRLFPFADAIPKRFL